MHGVLPCISASGCIQVQIVITSTIRLLNQLLTRVTEFMTGAAFLVLIVAVTIQVLGRSALFDSPVWTEELTRFALLYLTAFGVGLSFIRGDLVNVDIICESLPKPIPWLLRIISAAIVAALCCILIGPSIEFTKIGALQTSPALGWRMDFIHASILVLLLWLFVFSLIRISTLLLDGDGDRGRNKEVQA